MAREILVLKHIEIEGPGSIEYFFRSTARPLRTINLAAGAILPDSLNGIEAVISLGGPMNVYEEADYPFLIDEDRFLKRAVEKEVPILGICLGAQLLAKACDAKVKKAREKEVGWHRVTLTKKGEEDPLFAGLSKELEVFQWHEDTFDIPDGAAHLIKSGACPNQAFRFGKNAYGLQFHVEVTPEMVEGWIKEYMKGKGWSGFNANGMLVEAHKKKETFRRQADIMYFNFARIMKNRK